MPLHISSPFSIVSAGELREKLEKSEKRNVELEAQLADMKVRVDPFLFFLLSNNVAIV